MRRKILIAKKSKEQDHWEEVGGQGKFPTIISVMDYFHRTKDIREYNVLKDDRIYGYLKD